MISHSFIQRLVEYIDDQYYCLAPDCPRGISLPTFAHCARCHFDAYAPGGTRRYSCANFRTIYLFRYLAAHVAQTSALLSEVNLWQKTRQRELLAASLGGGPGAEALGLMDHLCKWQHKCRLHFHNWDSEPAWQPIFQDLVSRFAPGVGSVAMQGIFVPSKIDVNDHDFDGVYDVVFLSWILSEVPGGTFTLLEKAIHLTRAGGYIVISDRTEEPLIQEITTHINKARGYDGVRHDPSFSGRCGLGFPPRIHILGPKENYKTAYWVVPHSPPP